MPSGRNDYFILEPGFQLVLKGSTGFWGMTDEKLVITVLDETEEIDFYSDGKIVNHKGAWLVNIISAMQDLIMTWKS